MLRPQTLYMQNVIEWYRNAIQRMHAYQWPQQHGRGGRVDRVEWRVEQCTGWTFLPLDCTRRGRDPQEEQDLLNLLE